VARGDDVLPGRLVVSPAGNGDLRWEELAAQDEPLAAWCAERWLGPYRRLSAPPPRLEATRAALHQLAEHVISPARQAANGKIGLRYTRGGFGTPFFGKDVQVRVAGGELWVGDRHARITTLAEAALLVDVPAPESADEPLGVDPEAAAFLGEWYGFAASVLEELR
jgi:hypothetical protein